MGVAADFFVSYTSADRVWAEWIAWQLEQAGYQVIVQAWDFEPGDNFVARMRDALQQADRTLGLVEPPRHPHLDGHLAATLRDLGDFQGAASFRSTVWPHGGGYWARTTPTPEPQRATSPKSVGNWGTVAIVRRSLARQLSRSKGGTAR
jgi:hypothetical protein